MKIIIESPYNPTNEQVSQRATYRGVSLEYARVRLLRENIQYARLLMRKALEEGHAPLASHLLYTQVWSEDPQFRMLGISAGLEWLSDADLSWFGLDLGMSGGMQSAYNISSEEDKVRVELFPGWDVDRVRRHLASLPWTSFVGVP